MREGESLVGRYHLIRMIGRGAMGQVWLAHDELLNRNVAIKHLLPGSQDSLADDVVQRSMREARLAAQLNHPNVVQIFDLVMSADMPYVVMELVQGETLADRLASAGRLVPDAIRPVVRQVASCLAAAHELGIVHRDVKPANILIAANGVAKLADFGIARASQDVNLTQTGLVIGTLAYMAPEVAAGDPATPASDVWSLGATVYAATEGRAPFAGETSARALYRKVSEPPPVPINAGDLTELVQAMMAKESADRPAAREVAWALEGSGPPRWAGAASRPAHGPTTLHRVPSDADRTTLRKPPPESAAVAGRVTTDRYAETDMWSSQPTPIDQGGSHKGLVAAIVLVAVLIVGGAFGLVLANRSGSTSDAGGVTSAHDSQSSATSARTSPSSLAAAAPSPFPVTTTPTATPVVAPVSSAMSLTPVSASGATMTYYGPDGLSAEGPASWNNACVGADGPYYWCAGPEGFLGGYFRLRLKNGHTSSFDADVRSENSYFRSKYADGAVTDSVVTGWPVSANAVDLSYSFTNSQGQARRGIERVFTVDGARAITLIVAVTDTRASWPRTQQIFAQLVASTRA